MKYAAIDIGTNTVLMTVVEKSEGFREVLDVATITRLGQGLKATGVLSDEAMQRTFEALRGYRVTAERNSVRELRCVGTAALREARNSHVFTEMVRRELGFSVRVISERDEAFYTYLSVRHDLSSRGVKNFIVIDIGGGSTEIITGDPDHFKDFVSLPVGSVKLTEAFIRHDPPTVDEIGLVRDYVGKVLRAPLVAQGDRLIGTAGTITNIASLSLRLQNYDKTRVQGFVLGRGRVDEVADLLTGLTSADRRRLPGMEKGREDIILQGIILLQEVMSYLKADEVFVSANGVRFGVLYEMLCMSCVDDLH